MTAVVRDPALLLWLDAPANRKEHPNENLGRELMELFTLGIGNYTETDVKEAARTLTGWTVTDGEFRDLAVRHDAGAKTILGRKGAWKGDDLLRILLEHPATARRLAVRLCEQFFGEGAIDKAGIDALAEGLRRHDLRIGWAVETILRSRAFFGDSNFSSRVAGPAEYVVGTVRALEMFDPPPSTVALADWMTLLGLDSVLSAQRLRLAGRPPLDQHALRRRAGQLRRGAGRRQERRPARTAGRPRTGPQSRVRPRPG